MVKITDGFTVLDFETTGLDTAEARIVQVGMAVFAPGEPVRRRGSFVDPGIPIPKEASDIHGITDNAVRGAPRFAQVMPAIQAAIGSAPLLVTFNGRHYDLPLLLAEVKRAGGWPKPEPPREPPQLDVLDLVRWFHREARERDQLSLGQSAYGLKPIGGDGHDARVDAHLTGLLMLKMIEHGRLVDDVAGAMAFLDKVCPVIEEERERWAYWLYCDRQDPQTIRWGCGKEIGKRLDDVDVGYIEWMLAQGHVDKHEEAKAFLEKHVADVKARARAKQGLGAPPPDGDPHEYIDDDEGHFAAIDPRAGAELFDNEYGGKYPRGGTGADE